jgi:hypothetical protein
MGLIRSDQNGITTLNLSAEQGKLEAVHYLLDQDDLSIEATDNVSVV